jgi:DNA repair photolyase
MKVSAISNKNIIEPCGLKGVNHQIDTYVGCEHYCYYCYALNDAKTDWLQEIYIHDDIIGQLNKELERIPPQTIYLGYKTDPYQPLESELLQTRKVLELLLSKGFSASILTKSNLVIRDIDILLKMPDSSVSFSIAFENEETRKLFEKNTIDTELRINALRDIKKAGIKTFALLCPVIPYISEVKTLLERIAPFSDKIWIYALSILSQEEQSWSNVKNILNLYFPQLFNMIEEILFSKEHNYWKNLRYELDEMKIEKQLNLDIHL